LVFTGPSAVEVRREPVPSPGPGEVLVHTSLSAISAGTELLIYAGLAPAGMPADSSLRSLPGTLTFPLRYGYASVGRIMAVGPGVDPSRRDTFVFAFQPHQTHFVAPAVETIPLPPDLPLERAVLLPSAETALNLVHDGRPLAGEKVAVFGQGVVGLLTTALLAGTPLAALVTLDRHARRRQASLALGAHISLDPDAAGAASRLTQAFDDPVHPGADLSFEVSGDPAVLDQALQATGFDGRVIIGSWYGEKRAALNLGGDFHRSRIRLISSQVSTIAPELRGRWTHPRRLAYALSFLREIEAEGLITHRVPFEDAPTAYRLLAEHPEQAIQVVLTYPESS
jgi:2-desacetyl-2-hydroxyethyl bacteriochlorophyllide A dehydrogenase